jgi:hypothetical protein
VGTAAAATGTSAATQVGAIAVAKVIIMDGVEAVIMVNEHHRPWW